MSFETTSHSFDLPCGLKLSAGTGHNLNSVAHRLLLLLVLTVGHLISH